MTATRIRSLAFKAALGAIIAAVTSVAALAAPTPFTWNLSAAYPGLPGPFTADSIKMSDFLLNWQAQMNDTFILQINSFSINNGTPVPVPGLGTTFGLYLEGSTKGEGTPTVYGPGTISLVLDPTNNDGTPSATVNIAASTGAVGFSHPLNTGDDITLATGSLTYGQFPLPNGQPGVYFIETFTPAPGETGFSVSPTDPYTSIEELLFNTSTSRVGTPPNGQAPFFADGSGYVVVNDGIGTADLLVPEPASMTLLGAGLVGLLASRRRSASL